MANKHRGPGPVGEDLCKIIDDQVGQGISKKDIAKSLGMDYYTMIQRERSHHKRVGQGTYPFNYDYGKPLELNNGGNYMIVGDVHIPFTNTEFAMMPALIAERWMKRPRNMIIAGDLFNMDAFSTFSQIVRLPTWQEERIGANKMLTAWLETFDHIYFLVGNHERRLQRFTMGAFNEGDLLALIDVPKNKVTVSGYSYCTVSTKTTGTWRITHPRNYAQTARFTSNKLAQKYRQNIVSFHEHHTQMSMDDSGNNMVVSVGGLADGYSFPYVRFDDNTKPTMKKSFLMLKDGYPYMFFDQMSDWSHWLRDLDAL